uniref:Putative secreted protein n=1 Tax=Ixodes ricinus TaxID=34613 RepID=A0A6B0U8W2_IXORI
MMSSLSIMNGLFFLFRNAVQGPMHRKRIVVRKDAMFRNCYSAHLWCRRKPVVVFGEEVSELLSFRGTELGVNVELQWRCTVRLRW